MSHEKHKQTSQGKGSKGKDKAIMKKGNEVSDLTKEYGTPFFIHSHEGKKFHSLLKQKFTLLKFFDDDMELMKIW